MKDNKFSQPEFFPAGTVAVVEVTGQPVKEVTVKSITSNGVNSWVIETTDYNEVTQMSEGYNMVWVTKIIKRGEGGMVYSVYPEYKKIPNDKKGMIHSWMLKSYVMDLLVSKIEPTNACISEYAVNEFLNKYYPLPKKEEFDPYRGIMRECRLVSTKRIKKLVRRNVGRLLLPMKQAVANADRMEEIEYDDGLWDLDDSFDRRESKFGIRNLFDAEELDPYDARILGILRIEEIAKRLKYNLPMYASSVVHNGCKYVYFSDKSYFGWAAFGNMNAYLENKVTVSCISIESLSIDSSTFTVDKENPSPVVIDDMKVINGNGIFCHHINHILNNDTVATEGTQASSTLDADNNDDGGSPYYGN